MGRHAWKVNGIYCRSYRKTGLDRNMEIDLQVTEMEAYDVGTNAAKGVDRVLAICEHSLLIALVFSEIKGQLLKEEKGENACGV